MTWIATPEFPVYLFYCKANIAAGTTVVVMQNNNKTFTKGVLFENLSGSFTHQNAIGAAKQSGTRNILIILTGEIKEID